MAFRSLGSRDDMNSVGRKAKSEGVLAARDRSVSFLELSIPSPETSYDCDNDLSYLTRLVATPSRAPWDALRAYRHVADTTEGRAACLPTRGDTRVGSDQQSRVTAGTHIHRRVPSAFRHWALWALCWEPRLSLAESQRANWFCFLARSRWRVLGHALPALSPNAG